MDEIMDEAERKMKKAVELVAEELGSIRTSRASPALVQRLKVNYYGALTPLNQIASISAPEPRLLVIDPYDPNVVGEIEKAIFQSDLGLVPSVDGQIIRLPIPELTEERRRELQKVAKARAEEGRVAVRNVRREAIETLRKQEKSGEATEDDMRKGKEEIQKILEKYVEEIDGLLEGKIKELMEI